MVKHSPFLQIKYKKTTIDGQVIEELKRERNTSRIVRDYLTKIRGYDILKSSGVSQPEIIEFCVENVQFFHLQYEIAKIRLEQEMKDYQHNLPVEKIVTVEVVNPTLRSTGRKRLPAQRKRLPSQ